MMRASQVREWRSGDDGGGGLTSEEVNSDGMEVL